jgi:excinuclease ABC subunit A
MRVHSLDEINHEHFWKFVEEAVAGFQKMTQRVEQSPESVMPWTVLGRKWHLARKGFPPGRKIAWEADVLEDLFELLEAAAPNAQFLWNSGVSVTAMLKAQHEPWMRVATKKLSCVELTLCGPKGQFTMGRIAELGAERELDASRPKIDVVKLRFVAQDDLARGDLEKFLREHSTAAGNRSEDRPLFREAQLAASD